MILLDSSVIIELFRKKDKQNTLFYKIAESYSELYISSLTHYEVGIGNKEKHFDYWQTLCNNLTVIPFDKTCSLTAISIYKNLTGRNKMIDLADILIGATAVSHHFPIATLNAKHFERIENLEIIAHL